MSGYHITFLGQTISPPGLLHGQVYAFRHMPYFVLSDTTRLQKHRLQCALKHLRAHVQLCTLPRLSTTPRPIRRRQPLPVPMSVASLRSCRCRLQTPPDIIPRCRRRLDRPSVPLAVRRIPSESPSSAHAAAAARVRLALPLEVSVFTCHRQGPARRAPHPSTPPSILLCFRARLHRRLVHRHARGARVHCFVLRESGHMYSGLCARSRT